MNEHDLEQECPHCLKRMDRTTNTTNLSGPKRGDLAFCIYCGEFCVFGERNDLERMSDDFKAALPAVTQRQMKRVRDAWFEVQARKMLNGPSLTNRRRA
jgi:hypothetical protein